MLKTYTDNSVSRRPRSVNRHDHPISRRLKPYIARAVTGEPVKVLALRTGISADVIRDLREERRMPHVPTFLILAQHDPALRAQVTAIMSGEAEIGTAKHVNAIIRFMGERPG